MVGINSQIMLQMSSPDNAPKYRLYILKDLALPLLKPHLQQRSLIPSLLRSSKIIIKPQFNDLKSEGPEESPKKKGWCKLCWRKQIAKTIMSCTEYFNFMCKNLINITQ
ncbi:hypothetical protein NPIL_463781 [Nephila pilipes]|uniref:Uncharacterized protein n=1 Tax=Nephila pilipes TaxID=299642 RepID=A0A8X6UIW6_NEPPI|nr:hypothetical protein NPIL_463781 [Nephila pilipes]